MMARIELNLLLNTIISNRLNTKIARGMRKTFHRAILNVNLLRYVEESQSVV
jgi:hypothetical protein